MKEEIISIETLKEENKQLKETIDKAIEYIINEATYSACDEMDKLLDILRGEDNEEI